MSLTITSLDLRILDCEIQNVIWKSLVSQITNICMQLYHATCACMTDYCRSCSSSDDNQVFDGISQRCMVARHNDLLNLFKSNLATHACTED